MATLTRSIKKAEKLIGANARNDGTFYRWDYKGYEFSFHQNGREDDATGFYTRKHGMEDDHITDYFAGTFHDNVTQAIKFIDRMDARKELYSK